MKNRLNFIFFIPILIIILAVNICVDPATVFKQDEDLWVDSMLSGNLTYIHSSNFNERKFRKALIQKMPKNVDTIIFGPSLVFGVRANDVGTESFYNLGESGADIYDILANLGLLELNQVRVKKMIFCIDSYLFDKEIYTHAVRHKLLMPYSDYMIDILNKKSSKKGRKLKENNIKNFLTDIENAFSLTYFQASLKQITAKDKDIKKDKTYDSEKFPENLDILTINGPVFLPDGSYIYPLKYQKQTLNDVLLSIKNYDEVMHNSNFRSGSHISSFSKDIFEKIIKYYTDKGTKIELFICPLPPTYWEVIKKKYDFPIIEEQEAFAKELASKYNLSITGSMNPYNVGIKDEDFYDARHVRHELLSKFFDFKK